MPILTIRANTSSLRVRLAMAQAAIGPALARAIMNSGEQIAQDLAAAAPSGGAADMATPPAGDAPGPLRASFMAEPLSSSAESPSVRVITTQPTKLRYVRYGTGIYGPGGQPIRPRTKRALYWPGADHPVRSVRGMRPNDFVTTVLASAAEVVVANVTEAIAADVIPLFE